MIELITKDVGFISLFQKPISWKQSQKYRRMRAAEISLVTRSKKEQRKTDTDYSAPWCWYIVVKSFIFFEL